MSLVNCDSLLFICSRNALFRKKLSAFVNIFFRTLGFEAIPRAFRRASFRIWIGFISENPKPETVKTLKLAKDPFTKCYLAFCFVFCLDWHRADVIIWVSFFVLFGFLVFGSHTEM